MLCQAPTDGCYDRHQLTDAMSGTNWRMLCQAPTDGCYVRHRLTDLCQAPTDGCYVRHQLTDVMSGTNWRMLCQAPTDGLYAMQAPSTTFTSRPLHVRPIFSPGGKIDNKQLAKGTLEYRYHTHMLWWIIHFSINGQHWRLVKRYQHHNQGFLQLQAWVSANGVQKDCTIKVYLWYRILMKY